jgi:hypothetical protein
MLKAAEDYYRTQALLAVAAARQARRAWSQITPEQINGWDATRLASFIAAVQYTAAGTADNYTDSALDEQNISTERAGRVNAAAFVGVAGDGRPLVTLLDEPRISALTAIGQGLSVAQALTRAGRRLELYAVTAVQDAGRASAGTSLVAHTRASGWVRMLQTPSCSRCAILAGRVYRWSDGFLRHPRCDCRHVPVAEDTADDLRTDPKAYFDSLSEFEQDRIFTKSGAQAARDGADLGQAVNARRGMSTAQIGGRKVRVTSEGTTRRGLAGRRLGAWDADAVKDEGARYRRTRRPRLMPETIYKVAEDRTDAIRLLEANGYLL